MSNDIEESYCSFEVAKLLKSKGFNVPCNFYYYEKYYAEMLNRNRENLGLPERFEEGGVGKQLNKYWKGRLVNRNQYDTTTSRPTHALAIAWVRVNFNRIITVYGNASRYCFEIHDSPELGSFHVYDSDITGPNESGCWDNFEDATEEALLYTLKHLIK